MNSETSIVRNTANNGKTPHAKRAVGYFRVSTEEQVEGYSISAQERAYRQFVETHGYTSVGEYRDEGKSARTDHIKRRPQFAQMLQDAQTGLFDVIVVHKMDRFSRSMRVAVQAFEQLGKCNVGLVSVSEPNLDYSTPQGKLFMHMLWALAQFYSDNLAQEVRKGKGERRQQGLYNGFLPFGFIKDDNGSPIPDRRDTGLVDLGDGPGDSSSDGGNHSNRTNYDGLVLIFQRAADGHSCRQIAEEMNTLGYRTTGNRGTNLFTKDTVNEILRSRFYLGELPDGEYREGQSRRGVYTKGNVAKHQPLIPTELWETAQRAREANSKSGRLAIRQSARIYSLSGLATCSYCGGKMHVHMTAKGVPYMYCYNRGQGIAKECKQKASSLAVYEEQIEQYLSTVKLPDDYQQVIIEAYKREDQEGPGFEKMRESLQTRLARLKEMYEWGDIALEEYRTRRDQIRNELAALPISTDDRKAALERLVGYLGNIGNAWRDATQEQRNRLVHTLFEKVRIEDKEVKGVTPQMEFTPLLVLSHRYQLGLMNSLNGSEGEKKEVDSPSNKRNGKVSTYVAPAEATGVAPSLTTFPTSNCMSGRRSLILYFSTLITSSISPVGAIPCHSRKYLKSDGRKLPGAMLTGRAFDVWLKPMAYPMRQYIRWSKGLLRKLKVSHNHSHTVSSQSHNITMLAY